jgi:branched-chain amino acid transport system substrate-binding protein
MKEDKSMKKVRMFLFVFCLSLMFGASAHSASQPIKILAPMALTGGLAGVEQYAKEGAEMAAEQINTAGGVKGRPIQLIFEDCASTVPGAVNAMKKLLSTNPDATAVFGGMMSHFALAWDPIIREAKLPLVTGGSNVKLTAQGNPWIFRIRPNDETQTELLAKYIVQSLGAKSIGIFYDTNEYGKGGMESITRAFAGLGVKPTIVEAENTGDKDFTPQFLKFRGAKIDTLVAWNHPVEAALTVRFWQQSGKPFRLIGCPSYPPGQPTWSMVKQSAEGVMALADVAITDSSSSAIKDLAERYKAKHNKEFSTPVVNGYDAIIVLSQAMEKVGPDRELIRDVLHKGTYKGAMTEYNFDEKGDGAWEVSITEIKDGKVHEIERIRLK